MADGPLIAFQVVGDGSADIVVEMNPDESNIDLIWDEPDWRPILLGILDLGRLVLHDRRGLGVSSRNVSPPNLETRVSDLKAVLDELDIDRAFLVAGAEGGAMHSLFAATHPERVAGMLWNNPAGRVAWAPDYPWGSGPAELEQSEREALAWGSAQWGKSLAAYREGERRSLKPEDVAFLDDVDERRIQAYARINRNTATPDVAAEINRIFWQTDVRAVLPSVHAPATLVSGTLDNVAEAQYVASLMPNATLNVVEGRSGIAVGPLVAALQGLVGAKAHPVGLDTVLATVLFTDIVDSTAQQAASGDRAWKELIEAHHALVRDALIRWHGKENDTAGDGFYATFDGPARAIRCAVEIVDAVQGLGIEIRAGIHIGECELSDGKYSGLTVTIGARVASTAGPSEVVVSQTVKDLVAGSGLSFGPPVETHLKGVPGSWNLFRVTP
jgi:class 3 adenylate cyclase